MRWPLAPGRRQPVGFRPATRNPSAAVTRKEERGWRRCAVTVSPARGVNMCRQSRASESSPFDPVGTIPPRPTPNASRQRNSKMKGKPARRGSTISTAALGPSFTRKICRAIEGQTRLIVDGNCIAHVACSPCDANGDARTRRTNASKSKPPPPAPARNDDGGALPNCRSTTARYPCPCSSETETWRKFAPFW